MTARICVSQTEELHRAAERTGEENAADEAADRRGRYHLTARDTCVWWYCVLNR